jgi:uncharacterized membrane protein
MRFKWIDGLRGIAVIMMIYFHLMFDLKSFITPPIDVMPPLFWFAFPKITAALFIFISGISAPLRKSQHQVPIKNNPALRVLGWACVISVVSILIQMPVYFGILHCLGLLMLCEPWLLRINNARRVGWGLMILVLGITSRTLDLRVPPSLSGLGILLGVLPESGPESAIQMGDWIPLFPWVGLFLLGTALPQTWYSWSDRLTWPSPLLWLGRHSLMIYIVHQPILVGLLLLTQKIQSM